MSDLLTCETHSSGGKDVWLASRGGDKRSNNTEESSSFEYLMIALAPWCEKYLSMSVTSTGKA